MEYNIGSHVKERLDWISLVCQFFTYIRGLHRKGGRNLCHPKRSHSRNGTGFPHAADIMADRGLSDMEILFHPGDVSDNEEILQVTSKDDYNFLTSSNRMKEAQALKKFGNNISR